MLRSSRYNFLINCLYCYYLRLYILSRRMNYTCFFQITRFTTFIFRPDFITSMYIFYIYKPFRGRYFCTLYEALVIISDKHYFRTVCTHFTKYSHLNLRKVLCFVDVELLPSLMNIICHCLFSIFISHTKPEIYVKLHIIEVHHSCLTLKFSIPSFNLRILLHRNILQGIYITIEQPFIRQKIVHLIRQQTIQCLHIIIVKFYINFTASISDKLSSLRVFYKL